MVERLQCLHDKGIAHRDIKPGNFVMGRGSEQGKVFLIDFGLAHSYLNGSGEHIAYDTNVPFRGTHRYASVNAHMKIEQTRRDDLESMGYVLIYFLRGGLPWQNLNVDRLKRRQVIGEMKRKMSSKEITNGLPTEFTTFMSYIRCLRFTDKPDYDWIRSLFRKCYEQNQFTQDKVFDWTESTNASAFNNNNNNNTTLAFHSPVIRSSSPPQIDAKIKQQQQQQQQQEKQQQQLQLQKQEQEELQTKRGKKTEREDPERDVPISKRVKSDPFMTTSWVSTGGLVTINNTTKTTTITTETPDTRPVRRKKAPDRYLGPVVTSHSQNPDSSDGDKEDDGGEFLSPDRSNENSGKSTSNNQQPHRIVLVSDDDD